VEVVWPPAPWRVKFCTARSAMTDRRSDPRRCRWRDINRGRRGDDQVSRLVIKMIISEQERGSGRCP